MKTKKYLIPVTIIALLTGLAFVTPVVCKIDSPEKIAGLKRKHAIIISYAIDKCPALARFHKIFPDEPIHLSGFQPDTRQVIYAQHSIKENWILLVTIPVLLSATEPWIESLGKPTILFDSGKSPKKDEAVALYDPQKIISEQEWEKIESIDDIRQIGFTPN
jgi:hypothetical protein